MDKKGCFCRFMTLIPTEKKREASKALVSGSAPDHQLRLKVQSGQGLKPIIPVELAKKLERGISMKINPVISHASAW